MRYVERYDNTIVMERRWSCCSQVYIFEPLALILDYPGFMTIPSVETPQLDRSTDLVELKGNILGPAQGRFTELQRFPSSRQIVGFELLKIEETVSERHRDNSIYGHELMDLNDVYIDPSAFLQQPENQKVQACVYGTQFLHSAEKVHLTQTCKQNSKPDYDQSCQAGIAGTGSTIKIENLTKVSHVRPASLALVRQPRLKTFLRPSGGGSWDLVDAFSLLAIRQE
ncbi:hypothetical protein RRG08_052726 [Elysia crispata]|uniref:Uncharacterized protein n=1 Tax=Elysia crispata TaxID=231223 RepID=A0AAE1ALN1_9GAST|nr:hypothetical protein RRG08_052726 [Elysia crispata]